MTGTFLNYQNDYPLEHSYDLAIEWPHSRVSYGSNLNVTGPPTVGMSYMKKLAICNTFKIIRIYSF